MKLKRIKGYHGLEYIQLALPVKQTKHGEVLAIDIQEVDRSIAQALIRSQVPLRGVEVEFLRKTLGLSMAHFGAELSISGTAVMKWERAAKKRLDPINEVAVRALMAEAFKVKLPAKFSTLRGTEETPSELKVKAGGKAS